MEDEWPQVTLTWVLETHAFFLFVCFFNPSFLEAPVSMDEALKLLLR